jgi:hypothetical protein
LFHHQQTHNPIDFAFTTIKVEISNTLYIDPSLHTYSHIIMTHLRIILVLVQCFIVTNGFNIPTSTTKLPVTHLRMGLFDGVKEAFAAPARTSIIDAERETPIDRWMGWSVTKDKDADTNTIMSPQTRTFILLKYA